MIPIATLIAALAVTLQAASAATMLRIARATGWERVRLMAFIALSAGLYSSVNLVWSLLPTAHPLHRWIFEINMVSGALHGAMWAWYTFADAAGRWRSVPRGIRWQAAGTLTVAIGLLLTGGTTDTSVLNPVVAGSRGVATHSFVLSNAGNVAALLVLLMMGRSLVEYVARLRRGEEGARLIVMGFSLFTVCIAQEALVAAGVFDWFYLSDVGYTFIVVPLAAQLLGRFSADAEQLHGRSSQLAIEVVERTSERDLARETLVEQQRLAALGRLAAGVGHEINNPLQYMLLSLEEIQESIAGNALERASSAVEHALDGADRIRRVVESLRKYGLRGETLTAVDLHEVIRAAVRIASPQLQGSASLRVELDAVPLVLGDEGQLVQVVVNPLVNAVQAARQNAAHRKPEIIVHVCTDAEGCAQITVSDTGTGFPPDILPRLGEPYVTSRAATGGTGLGVFVTNGLVSAHHGRLSLRNAGSGGAVVQIVLPPHTPAAAESLANADRVASVPVTAVRGEAEPETTALRILLVDDEPALLTVLARILDRRGHAVTTATNGYAAFELASHRPFDLVISDLTMPECTGVELASLLESSYPALRQRLIVMTGGAMTDEHAEFLARDDVMMLEKPVRIHALEGAVARLMERAQQLA